MEARKRKDRGITLIALVITIIVMMILAGVTLSVIVGENSIITNAMKAKSNYEKVALEEQLKMAMLMFGENGVEVKEGIVEHLKNQGYEAWEEDDSYLVEKDGAVYEIEIDSNGNLNLIELGTTDNLIPSISDIQISSTSHSLTISCNVNRLSDGTIKYLYSETESSGYVEVTGVQGENCTIEGLTANKRYYIKIEATNSNGTAIKTISGVTVGIPGGEEGIVAEGVIKFGAVSWNGGKARVNISTSVTEYTLQYQLNGTNGNWENYVGEITGITTGTKVYSRLVDSTGQEGLHAMLLIVDNEKSNTATISNLTAGPINVGNSIAATVQHNIKNSGISISDCKWVYNTNPNEIGVNPSDYTGGTFSTNPQNNISSGVINTPGIYYLHVLTINEAGKAIETISNGVEVKNVLVTGITLNKTTTSIYKGGTEKLTITEITPSNAINKSVIWSSDNESIATVSSDGLITTKAYGTVKIRCTAADGSGVYAECTVTVYNPCFVAGTLVSTPNGLIPIEELNVGDKVYTMNEETQKIEIKELMVKFEKEADIIVKLEFENGETIENTVEHPYYVIGKGWTEAKELKIGDKILTQDKQEIEISTIQVAERPRTKVYNMHMQDNHNYFVGASKLLVHNASAAGNCGLEDYPID